MSEGARATKISLAALGVATAALGVAGYVAQLCLADNPAGGAAVVGISGTGLFGVLLALKR